MLPKNQTINIWADLRSFAWFSVHGWLQTVSFWSDNPVLLDNRGPNQSYLDNGKHKNWTFQVWRDSSFFSELLIPSDGRERILRRWIRDFRKTREWPVNGVVSPFKEKTFRVPLLLFFLNSDFFENLQIKFSKYFLKMFKKNPIFENFIWTFKKTYFEIFNWRISKKSASFFCQKKLI